MANELKIVVKFDTGQAKTETKQFAEGSIGALEKSLRDARKAMKDLQIGTQEHAQALLKFKQTQAEVNDALGRGFTAIKNATAASGNAAMTLQALNYTVRDSPYFFRDFSLGILAVGNNINPLIDGLKKMNDEAKASNMTFMQMAKNTLGSGGMFTLGMSFAVTAIQAVTFMLAKNKKEVSETKTEYDKLTDAILRYSKQALGGLIIDLESRQTAFALALSTGRKLTEQEQNTAMEIQKQVKFAKERLQTMGDIESINNRMSELETEKKMLKNTGLVDGLVSPASVARLKEINVELGRLRKLTSTKDGVAKEAKDVKDIFADLVIKTTEELDLEIKLLEARAKNASSLMQQQIYLKGIKDRQQEITLLAKQEAAIKGGFAGIDTSSIVGKRQDWGGYNKYREEEAKKRQQRLSDVWGMDFTQMTGVGKPDDLNKIIEQYLGGLEEQADKTKKALQGIDQAAGIAGNAISNAFLKNEPPIKAATEALKQFIVQLLVIQSLKYLLTAIFAPASLPTTVAGFLGFSKKMGYSPDIPTSLPATPELSRVLSSANSVAQRQNSAMVVNVQGELVGSGSNLKAIIKKRDTITAKYY